MQKLLTIVVLLALGGCAAPQEQALKKLSSVAPAQAHNPVNCTTQYRLNTSYTTCN